MKYEVKMSCGHTETIQLFGKIADRERRIEWLERDYVANVKKNKLQKKLDKRKRQDSRNLRGPKSRLLGQQK